MKRFITFGVAALILVSCSTSVAAVERANAFSAKAITAVPTVLFSEEFFLNVVREKTLLEQHHAEAILEQQRQEAYERQLRSNTNNLGIALEKTNQYVGKTWYVFSGSTPEGWDCSGLVRWTYSHLGIELEHSATAQMRSGEIVETPKVGDVVAFLYKGKANAYHVGLYMGPDTMLHSGGKKGDKTELRSISAFAGDYSDVVYTQIVKTN